MDAENEIRYTIELDICYGVCYNKLQSRLLSRVERVFKLVEVFLGSMAFVSFMSDRAEFAGIAGLALAIINAFKFAVDFGALASKADVQIRRFSDLSLISENLSISDLRRQLKVVQSGDAPVIESLRLPAYNLNLIEHGRDDCIVPLSWRERFMKSIA